MRGNIKSFEKSFTHAEVVALAERTLKRFGGDRNKAGRYARSMENRYESSKWAQVVEVLATSGRHHATKKKSSPTQLDREVTEASNLSSRGRHSTKKSPKQLQSEINEALRGGVVREVDVPTKRRFGYKVDLVEGIDGDRWFWLVEESRDLETTLRHGPKILAGGEVDTRAEAVASIKTVLADLGVTLKEASRVP